jgi:thioredoxin-dependent peroxiredoxin
MNKGLILGLLSFLKNKTKASEGMKHLKEGDIAPDFSGRNEYGDIIKLSDFKGKKLALFFYPADNTPGCTNEVCSLRDYYKELKIKGIELLGVSPDSKKKHQNFIKKYNLPFPLIADEDLKLMMSYGVWGNKKFMGRVYDGVHRTTFLINEKGIIEKIFEKVVTKNHALQILETLQ